MGNPVLKLLLGDVMILVGVTRWQGYMSRIPCHRNWGTNWGLSIGRWYEISKVKL
jgi:hypothetical protein